MAGLSISQRNHHLLLVPFAYAFFSRMHLRGFVFNAATLWMPGLILVLALRDNLSIDGGALENIARYFAAYLAFISVYEIGYLINDTWGTRHDKTPRRRIPVDYGAIFCVAFVAVRIAVVLLMADWLGILELPIFWLLMAALIATIILHNTLKREEFKLFSFLQMSMLRFSMPVLLATSGEGALPVLLVALCGFSFPRFLTYQDSKGRLRLPERKAADFAFFGHLCFAPLILLIFATSGELAVLLAWGYFLLFGLALALVARSGAAEALRHSSSGDTSTQDPK